MYNFSGQDLSFFYFTNTVDGKCGVPYKQFTTNFENLILNKSYDLVDGDLFFYVHFAIDIIIL